MGDISLDILSDQRRKTSSKCWYEFLFLKVNVSCQYLNIPCSADMKRRSKHFGGVTDFTSIAVVSGFVLTHSPQDAVDDHAYEMYG